MIVAFVWLYACVLGEIVLESMNEDVKTKQYKDYNLFICEQRGNWILEQIVPNILSLSLLHLHAMFNMNPSMFTFSYHFSSCPSCRFAYG
jgi:hypothetical protein